MHDSRRTASDHLRLRLPIVLAAIAVLLWIIIRNAWLSDDGYITMRVVENFIAGYGPNFNVGERVQVFTHPLWMLVLSAAYFGLKHFAAFASAALPLYHLTIWMGVALTAVVLAAFFWRLPANRPAALCSLIAIAFSRSFVHYSTSGLENPLSHLILLGFVYLALFAPSRVLLASLAGGLAVLTRQDFALLIGPYLVYVLIVSKEKGRTIRHLLTGILPLILWEVFALLYFGSLLPNTAYAKLNTGLDRLTLLQSGLVYVQDLWVHDRTTFIVVAAGIAFSLTSRNNARRTLAAGMVLYLTYVVWIGGDFMSGRFFSTAFVMAVGLLATLPVARGAVYAWLAAALAVIGLSTPNPPFLPDPRVGFEDRAVFIYKGQVTDERAYYYARTGLLVPTKYYISRRFAPPDRWVASPDEYEVRQLNDLGVKGYAAGPSVHVYDTYALSDPLLARLPAYAPWASIGHATRLMPAGYLETLQSRENRIEDPSLALYYDELSIVTRGELFDPRRLEAIVKINLGAYEYLLNEYTLRSGVD